MEKTEVSVVIPAYNVGHYIEECLKSIAGQPLPPEKYEIIVVNDGSTDDTLQKTEKMASRNSRIRVISQPNRGLGNARNTGLRAALGKYILFADADDWFFPDTLPRLLHEMRGREYEMLLFRADRVWENGRKKKFTSHTCPAEGEMTGVEFMNRCNVQGGVWSFMYRRSFLLENDLYMPEGIYFEDELFIPQVLLRTRKMGISSVTAYAYRQRESSITSATGYNHIMRSFADRLYVTERLCCLRASLAGEAHSGLDRKIGFFCMDILRLLGRADLPYDFIKDTLGRLRQSGAYPPPARRYSLKYAVFRRMVCTESRYFLCLRMGLSRFF